MVDKKVLVHRNKSLAHKLLLRSLPICMIRSSISARASRAFWTPRTSTYELSQLTSANLIVHRGTQPSTAFAPRSTRSSSRRRAALRTARQARRFPRTTLADTRFLSRGSRTCASMRWRACRERLAKKRTCCWAGLCLEAWMECPKI